MENTGDLKISVITVCKNSERYLKETIESVIGQQYGNIEYILIDGESTDSTITIIREYESHIHYWISEEDNGMYDAINKGLKQASGDYILVLNSDDTLAHENVIQQVASEIMKERLDYYYGNMIKLKDGKNKKVQLFSVSYKQLLLSTHGTFAPHPVFFISKDLNAILGGYAPGYKYAADYDYILRALSLQEVKGRHLNLFITKFRMHNESITASGRIDDERKKILLQHGYYKKSYLKRVVCYYSLWVYYKIINIGHRFRAN